MSARVRRNSHRASDERQPNGNRKGAGDMKSDMATAADLRRAGLITARGVEAATKKAAASGADVWLTDPAPRGAGRLAVRCRPNGARLLVYRYTRADGARDALALGPYDPQGLRGLDLSEARQQAGA
ncbi:MAG: DUF4102 domain-containing protein, partial [Burkholderiales bacterium]|nr:DUF4102 domain-containing protein [Burkholderiales bacterium]